MYVNKLFTPIPPNKRLIIQTLGEIDQIKLTLSSVCMYVYVYVH